MPSSGLIKQIPALGIVGGCGVEQGFEAVTEILGPKRVRPQDVKLVEWGN